MAKKRSLTLIEVCIAFGLMAIVVYTLFSSLLQTIRTSKSLDHIKAFSLKNSLCYDRLLHIFSHTDPESFIFKKDENGAIICIEFRFENGLDPALIFSGKTSAMIFPDTQKNLVLNIFSKDRSMVQSEILLANMEELEWKPNLPFFLSLETKTLSDQPREFVFFFSDRPEGKEAYPI